MLQSSQSPSLVEGARKSWCLVVNRTAAMKRKEQIDLVKVEKGKRQAGHVANTSQSCNSTANHLKDQEAQKMMQENRKLRAKCLEYDKRGEELNIKVEELRNEMVEVQHEYKRLLEELKSLDFVKDDV
ncbi:hypothetical protein GQ457_08G020250 [Hibiscus cannabinus]